ncbi:uncharacterized protein L969DRAFT_95850 [Mixia osmundae IAM 14324]|uniref:DUF1682-domain-containing protein n=1 Tax=Mixia osmundae (strain CBS 9802 / IAM 14324 / JCM 22182 / KY 12970) TaxID=764103 RepID=G7DSD7_MIXOS|nr:uncharacterized protein L969DRAFT_95850 [Mixia osmundae IAM 14324]KEI38008.1 hypothetical protein L969DRAFT_95850 [Mixia osmundae IAM 14324]GAA93497.1 hypothetical protein E5Q_00138 [Mixia osmundae IAM 14324]
MRSTVLLGLLLCSTARAWTIKLPDFAKGQQQQDVAAAAPEPAVAPSASSSGVILTSPAAPEQASQPVAGDTLSEPASTADIPTPSGFGTLFAPKKAPVLAIDPYDGLEYRFKRLVFRPATFYNEAIMLAFGLLFIVATFRGRKANARRAEAWMDAHVPLLESQFSHVGASANGIIKKSSPTDFMTYASGRRGLRALTVQVKTRARHDISIMAYEFIRQILDFTWQSDADRIKLEFALSSSNEDFIFALSQKTNLNTLRQDRWDLGAFTSVTESSALPPAWATMSESTVITQTLLTHPKIGLVTLFKQEEPCLAYLESIVVTDLGTTGIERPDDPILEKLSEIKDRRLVMTLALPPTAKASETLPLLVLGFNFVDVLSKPVAPADTVAKLKKNRKATLDELLVASRKEARDLAADALREKKRSEAEAKLSKLSPAEQKRLDEIRRKREQRKSTLTPVTLRAPTECEAQAKATIGIQQAWAPAGSIAPGCSQRE